jgi:hypothetical protein
VVIAALFVAALVVFGLWVWVMGRFDKRRERQEEQDIRTRNVGY